MPANAAFAYAGLPTRRLSKLWLHLSTPPPPPPPQMWQVNPHFVALFRSDNARPEIPKTIGANALFRGSAAKWPDSPVQASAGRG